MMRSELCLTIIEISKFCTGTNKNGIEHAMRGIRKDAENISEAVKAGTNTWEVLICGIGQNIIPKGLAYDVFTSRLILPLWLYRYRNQKPDLTVKQKFPSSTLGPMPRAS